MRPLHSLGLGETRRVRSHHHSPPWAAAHMHCWQIRIYSSTPHLLQNRDWHSYRLGPSHCSKGHSFLPFCHLPHSWAVTQSSWLGAPAVLSDLASCPCRKAAVQMHICFIQTPVKYRNPLLVHSQPVQQLTVTSRIHHTSSPAPFWYWLHWPSRCTLRWDKPAEKHHSNQMELF